MRVQFADFLAAVCEGRRPAVVAAGATAAIRLLDGGRGYGGRNTGALREWVREPEGLARQIIRSQTCGPRRTARPGGGRASDRRRAVTRRAPAALPGPPGVGAPGVADRAPIALRRARHRPAGANCTTARAHTCLYLIPARRRRRPRVAACRPRGRRGPAAAPHRAPRTQAGWVRRAAQGLPSGASWWPHARNVRQSSRRFRAQIPGCPEFPDVA